MGNKNGIHSIIGAGSQVDDYYTEWKGRFEKSFSINWNVPQQPLHNYKNVIVKLKLDKDINIDFPSNFWPRYTAKKERGLKTIEIYNAMLKSEAENIKPTSLTVKARHSPHRQRLRFAR